MLCLFCCWHWLSSVSNKSVVDPFPSQNEPTVAKPTIPPVASDQRVSRERQKNKSIHHPSFLYTASYLPTYLRTQPPTHPYNKNHNHTLPGCMCSWNYKCLSILYLILVAFFRTKSLIGSQHKIIEL